MATKKPTPAQQKQGAGQAADEVAAAAQARKRDTQDRQRQADSIAPSSNSRSADTGEIAKRAYERYLQRGGQHGNDQDDWFQAERDLKGGGGQAGGHQQ